MEDWRWFRLLKILTPPKRVVDGLYCLSTLHNTLIVVAMMVVICTPCNRVTRNVIGTGVAVHSQYSEHGSVWRTKVAMCVINICALLPTVYL